MTRIREKFAELDSKKEKALIAYIMVGFPNEKSTLSSIRGLVKGGVDIIELGFPFSDPLADGPVIQNASTISLDRGTKIAKFFALVKKIRNETDIPLILMTYTNILYHKDMQNLSLRPKRQELTDSSYQICQLKNQKNIFRLQKIRQIQYS